MEVRLIFIKEQHELDKYLPKILEREAWGCDTETNGTDPHVNKVLSIQLGRPEQTYVIDARRVNPAPLKETFFENDKYTKIFHNVKFDHKMMRGTFDINMERVRCTFLAEKIMTAGVVHYLSKEHKWDNVISKRLGKTIKNKEEMQKSFIGHEGDFSAAQLEYMGDDVQYSLPVYQQQAQELIKLDLVKTMILECDAALVFGDMEFEGMKLDPDAWSKIILSNKKRADELKLEMDKIAAEYIGCNLFGEIEINYASPAQMLQLLQKMGVKVNRYDFRTKEEISELVTKTDTNSLKGVKCNKFIELLREWRSTNIRITNFGDSYINAIHPLTGCIHPNMWQIGTGTGRPASGESDVNPLNVPRDQKYRSCFTCDHDELVESDDFSGCESRILAHISKDPLMLGIFNRGEDIHCGAATEIYGVPVTKKNENKHLRTPAKALNFGGPRG